MGNFSRESASIPAEKGSYELEICHDWKVWGPNGGYLAACLLRAVGQFSDHPKPISYYGQYLRVAEFGPARIIVECIKQGRTASAYSTRLMQGEKLILQAQIWAGTTAGGLEHRYHEEPVFFVPLAESGGRPKVGPMPFWDNLEIRNGTMKSGRYSHWYRYAPTFKITDAYLDAARSLVLIDSMQWPAAWHAHNAPPYVAPSLDLYTRFHGDGSLSDWLFSEAVADTAGEGLLAGSASVWSTDGVLLATGGSQSLCLPHRG